MNAPAPRYWFRPKRYGWGWGLPVSWEGWVVLGLFAALMVLSAVAFPVESEPLKFFACISVLAAALVAVCWWKGPPPKWRWGDPA